MWQDLSASVKIIVHVNLDIIESTNIGAFLLHKHILSAHLSQGLLFVIMPLFVTFPSLIFFSILSYFAIFNKEFIIFFSRTPMPISTKTSLGELKFVQTKGYVLLQVAIITIKAKNYIEWIWKIFQTNCVIFNHTWLWAYKFVQIWTIPVSRVGDKKEITKIHWGESVFYILCFTDKKHPILKTDLFQHTLKNNALWKNISKCFKFGTKSTNFEKKNQSALISAILTHFEKKIENQNLHGLFFFYCLKNPKTIIKEETDRCHVIPL